MSASEDVKTLFRRFGGEPETYQEVVRDRQAQDSLKKWAILSQVNLKKITRIPSVQNSILTSKHVDTEDNFEKNISNRIFEFNNSNINSEKLNPTFISEKIKGNLIIKQNSSLENLSNLFNRLSGNPIPLSNNVLQRKYIK